MNDSLIRENVGAFLREVVVKIDKIFSLYTVKAIVCVKILAFVADHCFSVYFSPPTTS
jgi:hypothetical protein